MKERKLSLLTVSVLFLIMLGLGTSLAVVDRTVTVTTLGTMASVTSLSAQAKNISDNANATEVSFGTVTVLTNKLAGQYVWITVRSNVLGSTGAWELEIYTRNFTTAPSTTTWGYQYGGLKGSVAGHRVPLVWKVYCSTHTVGDPPANLANWMFVKDRWDLDIPGTPDDESWGNAHQDANGNSYTNIAYGGPDYMMVIEPGTGLTGGVLDTDNTFAVYLGGQFSVAASDVYSTIVRFDLYHE